MLPWIFSITRSVMIDQLRKDKNLKLIAEVDLEQIPAATKESESQLDPIALLQGLPEMQKTILQMRYLDDKTFEEIAESLKTSPSNVRQIVSRGIKRLREQMNQGGAS